MVIHKMMKKLGLYIFFGLMVLSACDLVQLERKNFIVTGTDDSLDYTSAVITGTLRDISNRNNTKLIQHGHCWDTTLNPSLEKNLGITQLGEKTSAGEYTSKLSPLRPNLQYTVRGYFINQDNKVVYGENFTLPIVRVTTLVISPRDTIADITGSADIVANNPILEHGHCWSLNPSPTIADSVTKLGAKSNAGNFVSSIKNLTPSTTYYARSYILTPRDTLYGQEGRFITLAKQ